MINLTLGTFPASFKVAVRHASAVRKATDNVICIATDETGRSGLGEGCPRDYVTGETSDTARRFLENHAADIAAAADTDGLAGLQSWMLTHNELIDDNPAAFCAIELALLDLLARQGEVSIEEQVGLATLEGAFRYTAVLGDNSKLLFAVLLHRYLFRGFDQFKLKLSGNLDRDRSKLTRLRRRHANVRVDANNLWDTPGPCIDHLRQLEYQFFGIEEPLRAHDLDGFVEISQSLRTPIILDESGLRASDLVGLPGEPENWIINCRVSKMGGLLRTLDVIEAATTADVAIIVGAQVGETSILSRAGLTAAWAAGNRLVGQEGAFGTNLLREDLTVPVIQFNRSGRITAGQNIDPTAAGFGLQVANDLIHW